MVLSSQSSRRISALAAACLLSVALPAVPALAQKTKTKKPAEPAQLEISHTVSIPTIEAVGSNLDEATLKAILSGDVVNNADDLAGLNASSITVPEINVTITAAEGDDVDDLSFVLNDFVLTNVVDGVAETISIAGTEMTADDVNFSFGAISAAKFNIAGVLGVYGLVDASAPAEMATIYTDFQAEGGQMVSDEVTCAIGPVAGAEFKARPLSMPLAEIITLAEQMEDDPDTLDPAVLAKFVRVYADMLTAFETSEVTMGGIECNGVDDDDRAMRFTIGNMVMGGMSPGIYPAISVDGVEIDVEDDGRMSVDNLLLKETDLSALIATLQSAPDDIDEKWFEDNARGMIPSFGGFSFSGFSMDIPDPDDSDARIQADIGEFDLTLASYINGIPSLLDVWAENIQAEIPEGTGEESFEMLRSFGVTAIDAGFRLALAWDEVDNAISVEEVSFSGEDLASVALSGLITNATIDLFSEDLDTALATAMDLAVNALDLEIVDEGLSDILLSVAAAEQGVDPATLRPVFAGLAQGTVIGMMAGAADAAKLGDAINAFVSGKAKTLQIGLTAKDEAGIGLLDFMAAEDDPASLLTKLNVSATAK
ncbi:MAG: hypothetical protein GX970_15210 [Phyllobacteriaceae bacterium]|nr:hypothetical protein [Phyllobacteriaceae bacterium]